LSKAVPVQAGDRVFRSEHLSLHLLFIQSFSCGSFQDTRRFLGLFGFSLSVVMNRADFLEICRLARS
jgi:hypothetical protein